MDAVVDDEQTETVGHPAREAVDQPGDLPESQESDPAWTDPPKRRHSSQQIDATAEQATDSERTVPGSIRHAVGTVFVRLVIPTDPEPNRPPPPSERASTIERVEEPSTRTASEQSQQIGQTEQAQRGVHFFSAGMDSAIITIAVGIILAVVGWNLAPYSAIGVVLLYLAGVSPVFGSALAGAKAVQSTKQRAMAGIAAVPGVLVPIGLFVASWMAFFNQTGPDWVEPEESTMLSTVGVVVEPVLTALLELLLLLWTTFMYLTFILPSFLQWIVTVLLMVLVPCATAGVVGGKMSDAKQRLTNSDHE